MYDVIFSDRASLQFKKLENITQQRIINALERIKTRPTAYLKKLVGDPAWRLKVGDYRVIVDLNQNQLQILVIEVGHRKNI